MCLSENGVCSLMKTLYFKITINGSINSLVYDVVET